MKKIGIKTCDSFFLQEEKIGEMVKFNKEDYLDRIDRLADKMKANGLDFAVMYGDREHFMNVDYFTGYDPRFEETLFVVDKNKNMWLLVGTEGLGYSSAIPYPLTVILYLNFGLQGQQRDNVKPLEAIFDDMGILPTSKVGVMGYKYLTDNENNIIRDEFDIPHYILKAIESKKCNVQNYTDIMTGLPDGLRMSVRTAKEIAMIDYMNANVSNVFLTMFNKMKEGITEIELSCIPSYMHPTNVHPMVCFGEESVNIGLKSPAEYKLEIGEIASICYSLRYSLTCRASIAAFDEASCKNGLEKEIEGFYKGYYQAVVKWYESLQIGEETGKIYDGVMDIVGGDYFGLLLNPGHNIGADEWTNSSFYKDSKIKLHSGSHLQCDIIASGTNPTKKAICEDGIIIADEKLRKELEKEYPEIYTKIMKRQKMMREVLGINIRDEVLPMSNLCGVYWPFMMDKSKIFFAEA